VFLFGEGIKHKVFFQANLGHACDPDYSRAACQPMKLVN
jgi:hypothetical protein